MNEDAIIRKLSRRSRWIGDDCAIYRPRAGDELLFTTDFSIEGVHLTRESNAEAIGRRALARSLSDIAAMGGTPHFCLVSLALPEWADQPWIDGFYRGLMQLAGECKTALAGGDLSHANQLVCDVMVCGAVRKGKALLRSGARPGDVLYVSGPLGGWRYKIDAHPRLDFGRRLLGKATACMDISDGLALDLHRVCLASKVSATLDSIPLLPGASIQQAFHDGEDYELLFTAPAKTRVPGTAIGVITKGKPGSITYQGKPLSPIGYDHFRNRT